jgi:hypothetical protein
MADAITVACRRSKAAAPIIPAAHLARCVQPNRPSSPSSERLRVLRVLKVQATR